VLECELYDPATGTWSLTGQLAAGGMENTLTLLADGRVLLAGGYSSGAVPQIYCPETGMWSSIGTMVQPVSFHTATLLPNSGAVLIAGGGGQTRLCELFATIATSTVPETTTTVPPTTTVPATAATTTVPGKTNID
jgi:uncharacterized iron-regulated membrane protein